MMKWKREEDAMPHWDAALPGLSTERYLLKEAG
jgi:hypothetical protein